MPQVPSTMEAVRLGAYGDETVLRLVEVPTPEPTGTQVLLRVMGTSVTAWDLMYRAGLLEPPPGRGPFSLPFQLGREAAGVVVSTGEDVRRFAPGDHAVAMTCPACGHCHFCRRGMDNLCIATELPGHQRFGGYAQYVAVEERDLLPAAASLGFDQLASLLWSYGTAWHMIFDRGSLRPGDAVLVTGASSGMGTACVQLARHAGAGTLIGLTGSEQKIGALVELGCDHVLNYKTDDVASAVRALTSGMGVDLVLDNVGGAMVALGMDALRLGGTLVNASEQGGRMAEVDLITLFGKHLNLLGSRAATRLGQERVLELAARGIVEPVISATHPLSEAAEAHRALARGDHIGKIVLRPHEERP